jgi:thiopeptide-type bacteriocin biosynthesis protein
MREHGRWPRWIVVSDYDNELPIDLDNVLSVETFAHMLRGRPAATIKELLPGPKELVAQGPEGAFVHELVVPFVRKRDKGEPVATEVRSAGSSAQRHFEPWSEWLYAKLYTGSATADRVLTDVVAPVARDALASSLIDRWFFIRYADPEVHVRVRFHGDSDVLCRDVLPRLREAVSPLIEQGLMRRVQLDTYDRELERYGGTEEAMEISEKFFRADSEAVIEIIEALSDDEWSQSRWRLTLVGMHQMLIDFGFDLAARLDLITRIRQGFAGPGTGRDIRVEGPAKKQLGDRFRQERDLLLALLAPEMFGSAVELDEQLSAGLSCLEKRSAAFAPIITTLKAAIDGGRSHLPLDALVASYLHMFANRLLRSSGGAEELVIYDFLNRLYWTLKARA